MTSWVRSGSEGGMIQIVETNAESSLAMKKGEYTCID